MHTPCVRVEYVGQCDVWVGWGISYRSMWCTAYGTQSLFSSHNYSYMSHNSLDMAKSKGEGVAAISNMCSISPMNSHRYTVKGHTAYNHNSQNIHDKLLTWWTELTHLQTSTPYSTGGFYPSQTVWYSCIDVCGAMGAEWNSSNPDFAREFQESALISTAAICCLLELHCWLYTDRRTQLTLCACAEGLIK